ncbi:PREDICTED: chitinase-like protein 2 [Camelina sativa]|uniref:Chitinase-like protein 2 n=1 Tax=Camelina sativa TaxID=90675 RepID=A0ABM0XL50_CAMSA|nr:PREDICTED: chitinase-like protein 2 [Camelina sativa]
MVSKPLLFFVLHLTVALVVFQTGSLVTAEEEGSETSSSAIKPLVKIVKGKKLCDKGWECKGWSAYCCNHTISDFFDTYQFEELFSKRNSPVAHAVGFWDYRSFITAAAEYQPLGFGTTGEKLQGMKEVAAFLGHVGSKTSCGYGVATGGPLAWGLCYNKEMSPDQLYCDDYYKLTYPCTPGVSYHGRGALPVYWNYNYGQTGEALKMDLLSHPEYLENNATLAFQAAIWRWMTPAKKHLPSAHDVFVGKWKPTKNDTASKRTPGFGATINVLYGDQICNSGFDNDEMNNIVSHYLYYLDLIGVGREEAGPHEFLSCADQEPFTSSSVPPTSGSSS